MDICARRWAMSEMLVDEVGASEAGGVDGRHGRDGSAISVSGFGSNRNVCG